MLNKCSPFFGMRPMTTSSELRLVFIKFKETGGPGIGITIGI